MKKGALILVGISFFIFSVGYAKGPEGKKGEVKPYYGAGIGKEVSNATKELKGEEKKGFGQTVREKARDKTRIRVHQERIEKKKEEKQTR